MVSKIIGIDLGTSYSCMSIILEGKPVMIPNGEGDLLTPSIVAFTEDDKILVGDEAKRLALLDPSSAVTSVKKLMGKKYFEIEEFARKVPYKIIKGQKGFATILINGKEYTPQEISAYILQKLVLDAETYLGTEIKEAVITIPDRFGKREIAVTKEAGELAGINVRRLITEPTAASLFYGIDKQDKDSKVAIFDLGGGSLDVTILELGDGVFEVKSSFGNLNLGGDDFDYIIVNWLLEEIKGIEGIDLSTDQRVLFRFKEESEKAKIKLSQSAYADIDMPYISISSKIKNLQTTLSRDIFKGLSQPLLERCKAVCKNAIDSSGCRGSELQLVFVGGSTKMPFIKEAVMEAFGVADMQSVNPDEIVALGAAIQGGVLMGDIRGVLLLDTTQFNFGIKVRNKNVTLIDSFTSIPTKKSELFIGGNQDELIDKLNTEEEFPYDVITPTEINGKQSYVIEIIEFDNSHENVIGNLFLNDVPILKDKPNRIEVIFDIDANGLLSATAKDTDSNIRSTLRIEIQSELATSVLEHIKHKLKKHKTDKKTSQFEQSLIKNAEAILSQSETQLLILQKEISKENRAVILKINDELKQSISGKCIDEFDPLITKLHDRWQFISQEIYLNKKEQNKTSETNTKQQIEIFISYTHKDEYYKNKLISSLSPLKRLELINIWNDREIVPGTLWEENGVYKNLESAQIIILLISSDFIESDYCYDTEIKKALKRHELNEVLVVPIIIRPTRWHKLEISKLQVLPIDARAVSTWANEDEAWVNVVEGIEKAVEHIKLGNLKRN